MQTPQKNREERRWIRKAKKGDLKAFERLVVKYQKAIYGLVWKMVLNHEDTDDIVQEIFVKAYTKIEQFDVSYSFYPWLSRIAVNASLNFLEKKRRYRETFDQTDEIEYFHSNNGNPLKNIIQDEYEQQIMNALKKLPAEQRMVFVLKTVEGLSYKEISEIVNVSLGTVMSRLYRAREKLRESLRPYLNGELMRDKHEL